MTQQALARHVGVTNFAVSNWEGGRRTPRVGELVEIARALDASLDWLLLGVPPGYDGTPFGPTSS
jgi:transcriptional regulator with XRE-family HTH domain